MRGPEARKDIRGQHIGRSGIHISPNPGPLVGRHRHARQVERMQLLYCRRKIGQVGSIDRTCDCDNPGTRRHGTLGRKLPGHDFISLPRSLSRRHGHKSHDSDKSHMQVPCHYSV